MRRLLASAILGVLFLGSGCIAVATPASGLLYTDVKWGIEATGGASSKSGSAKATSYFGLFATGDASIAAAKSAGGITKVAHVDYHTTNILGIIGTIETTVHGD